MILHFLVKLQCTYVETQHGNSLTKIGADFGNRDHTTVMYAIKKIEKEIKEKTDTKLIVESVKNIIQDSN